MNILIERQMAGYLLRNPERMDAFPGVSKYLTDPLSQEIVRLVPTGIGNNAVALSEALARNGYDLKPDKLRTEVLRLSDPEFLSDPRALYQLVQSAFQDQQVIQAAHASLDKLETGRINRMQYFQEITEKYAAYGDMLTRNAVDSHDWAVYGPARAAYFREMHEKGLMLYMPHTWPKMRAAFGPLIFGTLICLIGPSGGGKSITAEQLAYEWAFECGHNVLFANMELTNDHELWRYLLKYWPTKEQPPSIQQFQQGYWDARCDALARRFSNAKGMIRTVECSGASAADLCQAAAAIDGHLIVDYADMVAKDPRQSETLAVADMMTTFKRYAQTYGRLVVVVQQVTKAASSEVKRWMGDQSKELDGDSAMGSARFIQRSNLMLALNFGKIEGTEITQVVNPLTEQLLKLAPGEQDPRGIIRAVKSTFSRPGAKFEVFLDGQNYRLIEYKGDLA